jgi:hypothetical protein
LSDNMEEGKETTVPAATGESPTVEDSLLPPVVPTLQEETLKAFKRSQDRRSKKQTHGVSKYFKEVLTMLVDTLGVFNKNEYNEEELVPEQEQGGTSTFFPNGQPPDIDPKISRHSNKRRAVNIAEDSVHLSAQDVARRAGYDLTSIATVFEYMLKFNPARDRQVARVLSGWNCVDSCQVGGGRPPRLAAIEVKGHPESDKAPTVAKVLFAQYNSIATANNPYFRNLLLASILRFLPCFIDLVGEHPQHKYGFGIERPWNEHPFLLVLKSAASMSGVMPETLLEWGKLARQDFVERNNPFMPFATLQAEFGLEAFQMEARSVAAFMQHIAVAGQSVHNNVLSQGDQLAAIRSNIKGMQATMNGLAETNNILLKKLSAFYGGEEDLEGTCQQAT